MLQTKERALVEAVGKDIIVRPPKTPSKEVKEVLGGRWDKGKKGWRLPPTSMNVRQLVDWYGEEILDGAPLAVRNLAFHEWGFDGWEAEPTLETPLDNRRYRARAEKHPRWQDLYPYQQEAVEYLTSNPHKGSLLALSPGLGKAPTAVVAADVLMATRILIVCPLDLARNWEREWDRWASMYRSWSRATRTMKDPVTECVITNHEVLFEPQFYDEWGERVEMDGGYACVYDSKKDEWKWIRATPKNMKQWIQKGPKREDKRTGKMVPARKRVVEPRSTFDIDWELIIIDESVLLKNRKAVKLDMIYQLAKYAQNVWLLSGSPTTKYRTDLYPQMKVIMPRAFRSYWRFAEFFCVVDKNQWGWKIDGDKPDHDPQDYLRDFMFTRSQKEVLPDLPDYIYDPIDIDLNADQERAFRSMVDEWQVDLDNGKKVTASNTVARMTRLSQITSNLVNIDGDFSSAKEDLLFALLEENEIELPLLIWTWWVPTAWSIYDRLYDETDLEVDIVKGGMKREQRDDTLDAYEHGDIDALVLQMGVGKYGHTLTNTKTVFYHDRHFDSDAYFQSLLRVKRIGLEHRPRLIVPRAKYSADPIIEENLSGKLQSIARLGRHDIQELLTSLGAGVIGWEWEWGYDIEE